MDDDIDVEEEEIGEQEEEEESVFSFATSVEEKPELAQLSSEFYLGFHAKSYLCLELPESSRSTFWKDLFNLFPPLDGKNIDEAYNYKPTPEQPDDSGLTKYLALCKLLGIVQMSRIVASLKTHKLNLKYYGINHKQMRALAGTLKENVYITELNFQDNYLTLEQCQYLTDILQTNKNIRVLNLKECRIGIKGAELLGPGLEAASNLKILDLSFNSLEDEGLEFIYSAIAVAEHLTDLNLSHNMLGEDSAPFLGQALALNKSLVRIDFSWNNYFTNAGNKKLFAPLAKKNTVKWVNVSNNAMSSKGSINDLMKAARLKLEYVDVSNNRLAKAAITLIRSSIARSKTLREIHAGNNLITPDQALGIAQALLKNKFKVAIVDLENIGVNKNIKPVLWELKQKGKQFRCGYIYSNYSISTPDFLRIIFARANYLAMKPKKASQRKNFGHFILQLLDGILTVQALRDKLKKEKIKIDSDLIESFGECFKAKGGMDTIAMKECYLKYWPNTRLPTPPPPPPPPPKTEE